ncbi:1,6-anhydro-N-acetylmuramyl-L-alanine amidase AmpD [Psychrosphaera aestuarii]|uniref:1,6-anhydro-N-acetylmuramyl-L-alanine amidase AmpD n=1 Tax=Psychrosphaera aestuarii TaxID=1266052 RepID=UPI001B33CC9C|nr:1,6-anhydro-N-acetylmuramyl-L-alanine amidase AmpD [Psychrosphaera aestuarii]
MQKKAEINKLRDDPPVWLSQANHCHSEHCDQREQDIVDLLVIHNISLPPAISEKDFDNDFVEDFFTGKLDSKLHPYFESIANVRVSSHLYIKRDGTLIQFVPLNLRAWHAGVSNFKGREKCNDFSIGIELQGTDDLPFTKAQYNKLVEVTRQIQGIYPKIKKDNIVGHSDIAPGRKTDPGPCFDWNLYISQL